GCWVTLSTSCMFLFQMSSGFVSSSELAEERKKRQIEWEKVRKPDDEIDAPEPEVCNKSLFEQLKHNKDKKDLEIQEERALKNLVRGIDEDESQFLSMVNDIQRKDEKAKKEEEEAVMREMKEVKGRISIDLPTPSNRVKAEVKEGIKSKQAIIIGSLIKRKRESTSEGEKEEKKPKIDNKETRGDTKVESNGTINAIGGLVDYGTDSDE
ncbi:hypothetical protein PMAYCL1PPCAC_23873, partial [Pristionchus mayeri]